MNFNELLKDAAEVYSFGSLEKTTSVANLTAQAKSAIKSPLPKAQT
jgi:hypothetical protein